MIGSFGCRSLITILVLGSLVFGVGMAPSANKTVVTFWHDWPGEGGALFAAMAKQFNAGQPEIEVKPLYTPQIEQKLLSAVAANASPDVVFFPRFITGQWAARGGLQNIDAFVKKQRIAAKDYFPATWDEVRYRGSVWGIPFNGDARVLFYNKRLFKDAGLDPNKPPKNWDELVSYSEKLTKMDESGRLLRAGFVPIWGNQSLVMYIWQNGGEIFNRDKTKLVFNDKAGIQALDWVVRFIDRFGMDRLAQFATGFGQNENTSWIAGKVAMITEGSWNLAMLEKYAPDFLQNDLGLAPLPGNKQRATVCGGFSLVIPKGAKNTEAAMEFLAWANTKSAQLDFCKGAGVLPALKSAAYDPYFVQSGFYKPFVDALNEYARSRPVHPAYPEIESLIFRAVDRAIHHKQTPKEALDEAAERGQKILDKYNSQFK